MSFYDQKEFMRDGKILLYTTHSSKKPIWQARIKIDGERKYFLYSTKTSNLGDAASFAQNKYDELLFNKRETGSATDLTFEEHWQDWYKRQCDFGKWSSERRRWHKGYFDRYFNPYFCQRTLNKMTADFVDDYWSWRVAYWTTGPGYTERQTNSSLGNYAEIPSYKTLKMERSAIKQIFSDAHARRRLIYLPIIRMPIEGRGGRRPSFDPHEWQTLERNLRSYASNVGVMKGHRVNANHLLQRKQLRYYVLFMENTGLRVGEARQMRWEDITTFYDHKDGDTKLKIRVRRDTKTGPRTVISQPYTVSYLDDWKKLSPSTSPQDFVWIGQGTDEDGRRKPATNFNKTFREVLKKIKYKGRIDGLLNNADGERRTIYSLRHLYATTRLLRNVDVFDLALNMGTSVQNIKDHYGHVTTEQRSAEITKRGEPKKNKEVLRLQGDLIKALDNKDGTLASTLVQSTLKAIEEAESS